MTTKVPQIPSVARVQDPALRAILEAMKANLDAYRGTGPNADILDTALTKRDLFDAGMIDIRRGGRIQRGGGGGGSAILPHLPELSVPPAPEDLTTHGSLGIILLTFTGYGYANHAYTEVWRSAVDDLGQAVMIGTAQGQSGLYSDPVGASATYYYWVRFVASNAAGVVRGPYNAVAGTVGQTGNDPAYLLDVLTNEITSSQLHESLLSPIELIPDIALELGDVLDEIEAIQSVLSDIQAIPEYDGVEGVYKAGDLVKGEGGLYRALVDMLTPPPAALNDTDSWEKIGDYASLGEAVAAHAAILSTHDLIITDEETGVAATALRVDQLESAVNDVESGLSTKASIAELNQAVSDIYSAEVSAFTQIAAEFSSVGDAIDAKASTTYVDNAVANEEQARAAQYNELSAEFTDLSRNRDNLIVNPSFELGMEPHHIGNVSNGGTWTVEEDETAYHGGHVLQYDSDGQTGNADFVFNGNLAAREAHLEVRPGDRLRATIRGRLKSGDSNSVRLRMRSRDESASGVAVSGGDPTLLTSDWTHIETEWTVPEGDSVYALAYVEVVNDGKVGLHQFDFVRFERLDAGAYTAAANALTAAQAYADSESAAALKIDALEAQFGGNVAEALDYVTTHVDENSSLALEVTTLKATVGDEEDGLVALVQTHGQAIADIEGDLYAEYTIKVQTLGGTPVIAGIGLAAEPGGSTIGLMADRIFFAHPSSGEDITPFVYDTEEETVYVKNASIVNLTATNFVGEKITADEIVSNASITSPTIIGGRVQNTENSNFINLNATGSQAFIQVQDAIRINANGTATLRGSIFSSRFRTSESDSGERIDINGPGAGANRIRWFDTGSVPAVSIGAETVNLGDGNRTPLATFGRTNLNRHGVLVQNNQANSLTAPLLIMRSAHGRAQLSVVQAPWTSVMANLEMAITREGQPITVVRIADSNNAARIYTESLGLFFPHEAVGAYAFLWRVGTASHAPGSTHAASNLRWGNVNGNNGGYIDSGPSEGTWLLMGAVGGDNGSTTSHVAHRTSLYVRIA